MTYSPSPFTLLSRSCILAASIISYVSVSNPAFAQLRTWDNEDGDGAWLTALNWSGDDVPDTAGEDASIGDVGGSPSTVLLRPINGTTIDIGSLTIDAGSTFNNRFDSGTLNLTGGLSNSGTLSHTSSPSSNARNVYLNISGTNQIFNTSTGEIDFGGNSGRNRINVYMTLDAQNQNDGNINVEITGSADRDTKRLRLENSGTFTNNGSILIRDTQSSTSSYAQFQLLTNSAAVTLGGTGSITLDVGTLTDSNRARILGNSSGSPAELTNSSTHTIQGAGLVGSTLNLTNDGLVHATGDTAILDVNPTNTVTNNASGRMVASGIAGMNIGGGSGDIFTNNGLLEARSGSGMNLLATSTLNGTIAGGGTYTATTLSLTGSATLAAGDLSNADGTGSSTVGSLDVTGDLAFADTTIMNFQLGDNSAAGISFDTVNATGALTLDGVLNVEDLAGFGVGTYRLFTFSAGNLTDNGVTLGSTPGAYTYSLDADNAGGFVDLTVIPEPSTFVMLFGSFGLLYLLRKKRR
ncbi:PEP-CTERM sorting domain-containing protein [Kiritimatiellaeota bacterium B1221]|nr:PEP-CTERM sorting domain-containing protein [Kiritimatiellaeota bacterium B1221]